MTIGFYGVAMDTKRFFEKLQQSGIDFFTGVPDSLLKYLGNCIYEQCTDRQHIIAANEGNAIAIAAGSYIATGKIPLVYLQNSGLGNTVNPLLSMADGNLYAIPMIVMVGWRGQGGVNDAEQHLVQGPATPKIIEAMGYPYKILSKDEAKAFEQIDTIVQELQASPQPYFVVVEKGTLDNYPLTKKPAQASDMSREDALRVIAENIPLDSFVVTTTGKTSREWFEVREQLQQSHNKDFLTVGSMGHTSSIALGMAIQRPDSHIVCIDGDGSMLMHMGSVALLGGLELENFTYIVINNFSHESVGGLPTPLEHVQFEDFFKSMGFLSYSRADNPTELSTAMQGFFQKKRAVLEVRVKQGSRDDLARPNLPAKELAQLLRKEFK